jgi:serine/threonine protein kinase/tetratricopeptide (TPR) repeat protein
MSERNQEDRTVDLAPVLPEDPRATVAQDPAALRAGDGTLPPANAGDFSLAAEVQRLASREGPTVAGYEILRELGRGGMGVVYLARQLSLNRIVALKMISAGAHAGTKGIARFRAEAEAVARLQHANIVQIYEIGKQEGRPYFSLEFVDGGSLDKQIAGKPQPVRPAAQLVATLAHAMHYAHQHGIIHRDLKPGNILLQNSSTKDTRVPQERGREAGSLREASCPSWIHAIPKVTDFGLAKQLDSQAGQTQSGDILGTPSYMAPEQAAGQSKDVGPATDVYALGAILYELLTGRPPFLGETPMYTVLRVLHDEPVPPTRLQPKLPRDLETICLKCLEKDPRKRYPTAEAFAHDCECFLAGEPIQARPASLWERGLKWAKRRPAVAALVLVSGLALASLLAGGFWYSVRVTTERNRAAENLQRAERNFQRARQAVDQLLTEVASEQLASEPRMEKKQHALLEQALHHYQAFLNEKSNDPSVRKETGLAYQRMADLLRKLRQHDEAKAAYEQAIALLGQLAADFPAVAEYRQQLADSYNWLGELLRTTREPPRAREAYGRARDLQQRLVAEFPQEPAYRQDLARSHSNLGILLKDTGSTKDAEQAFTEALAILEDLVREFPEVPSYRQHRARTYLNLGPVLRANQRSQTAEEIYGQAIADLQTLVEKFPADPDYALELAVSYSNRGILVGSRGRDQDAENDYRQALARLDRLVADFPNIPVYRKEQANTYNSLGAVLARRRELAAAEQAWRHAWELFDPLVAQFPDVADYQGGLGVAQGNLGWLLLQYQELREARPHLEAAIERLHAALHSNPDHPSYQAILHDQYRRLIALLGKLGEPDAAARFTRAHEEFTKQLRERDPKGTGGRQ